MLSPGNTKLGQGRRIWSFSVPPDAPAREGLPPASTPATPSTSNNTAPPCVIATNAISPSVDDPISPSD